MSAVGQTKKKQQKSCPSEVEGQRGRVTRRALKWTAAALLAVVSVVYVRSLKSDLLAPGPSHLLLDRRARYLGEVPAANDQLGYWPLPVELPVKIATCTIETEDRNFYEHAGVYTPSLLRAVGQNLRNVKIVSGASTIAMQVARMQHPASRSLWSKLREGGEALLLIRRHGHDQVLRQYLTLAPYGNRAHGVVRAARLYFDKPAEDLSWAQAAFLAALPQQPGRMSPWTVEGRQRAEKRAKRILLSLLERQIITETEYRQAIVFDLGLVPKPRRVPEAMHAVLAWSRELKKWRQSYPSEVEGPRAPLIAVATLDLDIQRIAARAVAKNLNRLSWAAATNSAAVVTEVSTGEVLAYVGSADYFDEDAKGAIDFLATKRSPGSALKPFLYALALEKGTHTAASELPDVPTEFPTLQGGAYVPENMNHTFMGPILLRQALGNSRNIPALKLVGDVGVERALELFDKGGVRGVDWTPDRYGLSLAIGSLHVTPLELSVLYSALANGGETKPLVRWVKSEEAKGGADGRKSSPSEVEGQRPARLLSRDVAQMTTHMLADSDARKPAFPGGGALDFDYAVAVKTGTSQGYRDAWSVAFSDRLSVVVWVGNHDWRKMNNVSGATGAAPAAKAIMEAVMPLRSPHVAWASTFLPPTHWLPREVCPLSGKLLGPECTSSKTEYFAPGTEPEAACPFHAKVKIDTRNHQLATASCPTSVVVERAMLLLPEVYETWARRAKQEIAPTRESPLCPTSAPGAARIAITEPRQMSRYLYDPDTPRELSTIRLTAAVAPPTEEIVWLVDGNPIAQVAWPHELRIPLSPGRHTIRASFAHRDGESVAVVVNIDD